MKKSNIVYMMDALGNLWVDPDSLVTWLIVEKTEEKIWKKFTRSIVKEKLGLQNRLSKVHQRVIDKFENEELEREKTFIPRIARGIHEGAEIQIEGQQMANFSDPRVLAGFLKGKKPWYKFWGR